MTYLNTQDFTGETGFAVHTGMRSYDSPVRWKASQAQEGVLIASDGTVTTVLPGSELQLDGRAGGLKYDLFVFTRGGTLSGKIGIGGVTCPDGTIIGGFGEFRCSLLMARRCVPMVEAAFRSGTAIARSVSDLIRPVLRRAVETAVTNAGGLPDCTALCAELENTASAPMNDLLILHGLQLENLHIEWIGPTEENNEKRR